MTGLLGVVEAGFRVVAKAAVIILPSLPRVRVQAVNVLHELPALAKLHMLRSQAGLPIKLDHDFVLQRGEFRAAWTSLVQ